MTRRRRNILIGIAAVIVGVGFWQWWNWPRENPRFVGKWRTFGGPMVVVWTLFENGTGFVERGDSRQRFSWHVHDEQFIVQGGFPRWLTQTLSSLPAPFPRNVGSSLFESGTYEITVVSENELWLEVPGNLLMLRRFHDREE